MNDEQILAGFANLHQVITLRFDEVRAEFAAVRAKMATKAELRAAVGGLESRMMRRFDRIEQRLDDHEGRIAALERDRS